jgi:hypothetical protein
VQLPKAEPPRPASDQESSFGLNRQFFHNPVISAELGLALERKEGCGRRAMNGSRDRTTQDRRASLAVAPSGWKRKTLRSDNVFAAPAAHSASICVSSFFAHV